MNVLVVEDEKRLAEGIRKILVTNNYSVDCVHDGEAALDYALSGVYDLLVLDVMLPKKDGHSVAKELRASHCDVPILMLTALSATDDRIKGLDAGADYYLTKPFDSRELLACANALLRRQGSQVNELRYGDIALDLSAAQLICGENSIRLSAREFEVMRLLLQNPTQIHSKESILTHVWGYDSDAGENHVEVYIGFLRKKLAAVNARVSIRSERRLGYHLLDESETNE